MPPPNNSAPLDADALQEIVEGTASEIGEEFFSQLVKHLARAVGCKCAWVTEWLAEKRRLRALSFWAADRFVDEYEYDIVDTPCETVIEEQRLVHVPDRLFELYKGDPDLKPLGALSYMGIALYDTDGGILGHLAVLHDEPMPEDPNVIAIFNIFAGRAAAELRRIRRDRDLREREQKLSRLIESAMDAIIELDGDFFITRMNDAAEKTFGCHAKEAVGESLDIFLSRESRGKLAYLIAELERRPEGSRSLWIPEGLKAKQRNGEEFPAEATFSNFKLEGRSFYTLILRNINDRVEAEEHIRFLTSEAAYLRAEIESLKGFDDILGESEALQRVLEDVDQVSKSDTTVLILGETGTGKELIARAIHRRSSRASKPLINVNCAAIAAGLQESEFFGHEQGAFTGATRRREGRFKLADGGTIFLDEVGELPLDLQAKLLRVLQEGEFEPVGSSITERVDVRVIAATNRDLEEMVREGKFRMDLVYRLNVFPIQIPPLRDRGDDVIILANTFAANLARQSGGLVPRLTEHCKSKLRGYEWPGNVRELQNVIERAFITSTVSGMLNLDRALPESDARTPVSVDAGLGSSDVDEKRILTVTELRAMEKDNIVRALEAADWKVSGNDGAAALLGLKPNTLSSRMKALGITKPGRF